MRIVREVRIEAGAIRAQKATVRNRCYQGTESQSELIASWPERLEESRNDSFSFQFISVKTARGLGKDEQCPIPFFSIDHRCWLRGVTDYILSLPCI